MAEPAVSSSQDHDIHHDNASDVEVSEILWVNEILCFVDCEILRNLDADTIINSSKPAPLNSHASSTSKIERSTLIQQRNNCNKIFNQCIKLTIFNDCQKDYVSPLASFEIFPDLMNVATALKYIFGTSAAPIKIPAKPVAVPSAVATKNAKVQHVFNTYLTRI
jgi:hypothetical protein